MANYHISLNNNLFILINYLPFFFFLIIIYKMKVKINYIRIIQTYDKLDFNKFEKSSFSS